MDKTRRMYMAVDGGGTKTEAVVFLRDGTVLARSVGAATNPTGTSGAGRRKVWEGLLTDLAAQGCRTAAIRGVYAGVAGGGSHPAMTEAIRGEIRALLPDTFLVKVSSDAFSAWWSGTEGRPGIVLIAGTGTVAYMMDGIGDPLRVGGWGHLIGDEGSGYDIGRRALKAVMEAYEETGPATLLTPSVLQHFAVASPIDLIPAIYRSGKHDIAALSPYVIEAAQERDSAAVRILDQAASHLAELLLSAAALARRQGRWREPCIVVLSGGLWKSEEVFERFTRHLAQNREFEWVVPELPPVYGSVLCLAHSMDLNVTDAFKQTIMQSYRQLTTQRIGDRDEIENGTKQ